VKELVPLDLCRNTYVAVIVGLDAHHLAVAMNVYLARLRDLLRQGDDKLNIASHFEFGVGEKI
jgi:hypothetical protein